MSLVWHGVGIHNVSYPRVDPSVICAIISSNNERCLLVRKPIFPSKLYSLVSGFTDAGNLTHLIDWIAWLTLQLTDWLTDWPRRRPKKTWSMEVKGNGHSVEFHLIIMVLAKVVLGTIGPWSGLWLLLLVIVVVVDDWLILGWCLLCLCPKDTSPAVNCCALGESLEEACVREVHEEVGIDVTHLRYHSSQFWPKPSCLMAGFVAMASSSQRLVVDTNELESARWFDRSEVVDMLVHEHPNHLLLPPPTALSYKLIKSLVIDSAFTWHVVW